jgi:hypothetical protein
MTMMDIRRDGRCWRTGGWLASPDAWWSIMETTDSASHREPWNKGKIVGQKASFKLEDIWALRGALIVVCKPGRQATWLASPCR